MDIRKKVSEENLKDEANAEEPNLGKMIQSFESIVNNPLSKFLLQKSLSSCSEDGGNLLENGLKIYLENRPPEESCLKCRLMSKFISYVIKKGVVSFGVSEEELKAQMQDDYWAKGLTSVLKGIANFGVERPFIPGAPFQIVWNITSACNMNCIHCYEKAGKKGKDELSSINVLKGIGILADAGVTSIAFSGGEPTLHPDVLNFISETLDKGMFPAIATNGYALSNPKTCHKYVDAGLKFVQISIDGLKPETHDSFRGVPGAWEKAVEAVKNCVEEDIFVEVSTTITEHNINEIHDMVNFVRDLGAQWFMLYNFIPTGNGSEIKNMDLSPKKRYKLLEDAYNENSLGNLQILSTAPQYAMVAESLVSDEYKMIPTHFYNPEYSNPTVMQLADFIGGCGAGRFYMNIEPNGDIYPCVFFPHEKEVRVGNILEDDFNTLWVKNDLLGKLRDKDLIHGHCGKCEDRNICGGCRARAYNYFHDVLAPDPGCVNNEKEWEEIQTILKSKNSYESAHGEILIDLEDF